MQDPRLPGLTDFLQKYPHIVYATPSSPNFEGLRETISLSNTAQPLAIVRPQTESDVAVLVKYATSQRIKFVIRTGGNNLFGKSLKEDCLIIDMRDIMFVEVDQAKSTATIGGGILMGDLNKKLSRHGLVTPVGNIPSIGYIGWATYGGYGPFSATYGMGVDNVLGARVVNAQGKVVDADQMMLKGIRGAGGAFGVIVAAEIKVYPLKTLYTGMILFDSRDIGATFQKFNAEYQAVLEKGIPPQLFVQQHVMNTPLGRVFCANFTWVSENIGGPSEAEDDRTGYFWFIKIAGLAPSIEGIINTAGSMSIPEWVAVCSALVPPRVYGACHTINLRKLTDEVAKIAGDNFERMPASKGPMFNVHQLRDGPCATYHKDSVFGSREPHFMIEFVGMATEKKDLEASRKWASTFMREIEQTNAANILSGRYISLDPPGATPLSKIYGSNYETLLALKTIYDPENVFSTAIPALRELL